MQFRLLAWFLWLIVVAGVSLGQNPTGTTESQGSDFQRYDKNDDEKVTVDELNIPYLKDWFAEYDSNHDGSWDESELSKAYRTYTQARSQRLNSDFVPRPMDPVREVLATGLTNPRGLAAQPKTGTLFVSDSGAGRVVRIVKGKVEEVIVDFPVETDPQNSKYKIGPLGLLFLNESTLVVGGGGRDFGEDELSVFQIPAELDQPLSADQAVATFKLPASAKGKAGGDFLHLVRIERFLYVTCSTSDSRGCIVRATIKNDQIVDFERRITGETSSAGESPGFDLPMAMAVTADGAMGGLVVSHAGDPASKIRSRISVFSGTGKSVSKTSATLHHITGLRPMRIMDDMIYNNVTYATDLGNGEPDSAGLYRLEYDRNARKGSLRAKRLIALEKPMSMVMSRDKVSVYVATQGESVKDGEGQNSGQVLQVFLHESVVNPRFESAEVFRQRLMRTPIHFRIYDKNKDDKITKKEAGKFWRLVAPCDLDGNDIVDRKEYDSNPKAAALPDADDRFDRIDKNNDGALTEKEVGRLWRLYKRYDSNKDGKVTKKEYTEERKLKAGGFGR